MVDHAFLQPEAGIAYIDEEGRVTVTVATQYPHYDREEIADALGVGIDKIRVITAAVGGAFGGREDVTMQIHLALAAMKLRRPVKTVYTREESFIAHSKRHPMIMKYKTGALSDGTLYAMEAEIIGDSGAHSSWGINILRKAGVHATGPYVIPNVNVNSYAVYTNNPYTGAMRGFGAAQVAMAYEQQMDEIAHKLELDPVTIRLKNSFKLGSETATGQMLEDSVPLDDTILKSVSKFGADRLGFGLQKNYDEDEVSEINRTGTNKKRGKGIASIFYGTGYGNGFPDISNASAELLQSGKIRVRAGATEVGQGAKTALSQIAAEAMGLEMEDIELINEDTSEMPDSGTAAASRQTYNTGNGIRLACEKLKFSIMQYAAEIFEVNPFLDVTTSMDVNIADGAVSIKGLSERKLKLKDIYDIAQKAGKVLREETAFTARTTRMDAETGQGAPYWPYTFATYCVEVEVDTDTGKVDVISAVCAQDVGKAVNPTLVEGQIEGGFAMGMSWALYEDLGLLNGKIKNNNFSRYILPTSLDMPDIENIIVEAPESSAPFGAKGIGEPVMLAAMPAILNAIYDAVGIRINKLPASPQDILARLQVDTEGVVKYK
jgi:CO/xanthine dehydrogenase Mo-binding subunit